MVLVETCLVFFSPPFVCVSLCRQTICFSFFSSVGVNIECVCVFLKCCFYPKPQKMSREKNNETFEMHSDQRISWLSQHPPSLFDSKRVFDAFLQQIAFQLCVALSFFVCCCYCWMLCLCVYVLYSGTDCMLLKMAHCLRCDSHDRIRIGSVSLC